MRLSKAPLIATVMAAAIALLLVLPALAQEDTQTGANSEQITVNIQSRVQTAPSGATATEYQKGSTTTLTSAAACAPQTGTTDDIVARVGSTNYVSNGAEVVECWWFSGTGTTDDPRIETRGDDVALVDVNATGGQVPAAAVNVVYTRDTTAQGEVGIVVNSPSEPKGKTIATGTGGLDAWFVVVSSTANDDDETVKNDNVILAQDGETITISAGSLVRTIVVDGKGPSFTGVSPADGTVQTGLATTIAFTVTDNASGIIPGAATDPGGANAPDTEAAGAVDINVVWDSATNNNHEVRGNSNWNKVTANHSYSVAYGVGNVPEKEIKWYIEGWDRVNNYARTDDDPDDDKGKGDFTFEVDITEPKYDSAITGIGYDVSGSEEIRDKASVRVTFGEAIDSSRLRIDDFAVQGVDVVGIQHPNNKTKTEPDDNGTPDDDTDDKLTCVADKALHGTDDAPCVDTRKTVYLALSQDLADDATPDVTIYGGAIVDNVGNTEDSRTSDEADDGIRPELTVTLEGDATANLGTKKVDITIQSSEELGSASAKVYTIGTKADPDDNTKTVPALIASTPDVDLDKDKAGDTWTGEISRRAGEYVIVVKGTDKAGNFLELKGKEITAKSYDDIGQLAVIDNVLDDAEFELNPKAGKPTETESMNPFAIIEFKDEAGEKDSYDKITLNSITLNGEDVMGQVERASDTVFNIALFDLSVGSHELKYTATDPAGNTDSATFSFKVNERSPYEVALRPGWNLISVPASPADTMLSAVMGDNAADQVVAYQDGEWLSAVKSDDGTWSGTLTDVMAGYGYWVSTRTFQALEVSIPEANPGDSLLPTASVVEGWNLLGVMDPGQVAVPSGDVECTATTASAGAQSAKDYFSGLKWSVAYGYDPLGRTWTKVNNVDTDCVKNGSGYWLYADEAGTLVP